MVRRSDVSANKLGGTIDIVGNLTSLVKMYPPLPTGCGHRVPASTVSDPNEHHADLRCAAAVRSALQQNRFVGTVPAAIASLPAVSDINLADNTLTGELPAAFWTNPLKLTALCARRGS